uniref:Uncharacterized protein n=1 Tax=Anopheles dirus TaxID=7168 RepID=A0A182NWK1_9DIPT
MMAHNDDEDGARARSESNGRSADSSRAVVRALEARFGYEEETGL